MRRERLRQELLILHGPYAFEASALPATLTLEASPFSASYDPRATNSESQALCPFVGYQWLGIQYYPATWFDIPSDIACNDIDLGVHL